MTTTVTPVEAPLLDRIEAISDALNSQLVEREREIHGTLVALLAREHCFLLGPPGTGKTLQFDLLLHYIADVRKYKILLQRLTKEDEILGPLDMSALQETPSRWTRVSASYLPTAHLALIDEVWKGGSAILNSLLGITNEREWRDDGAMRPVDLSSMFCASNEEPQEDNLRAVYDRVMLRYSLSQVKDAANLMKMLRRGRERDRTEIVPLVTWQEILAAQGEVGAMPFADKVDEAMVDLRVALKEKGIEPSGRRFVKAQRLMQAEAWLDGASRVVPAHMSILAHVMWEQAEQCQPPGTRVMVVQRGRAAYGKRSGVVTEIPIEDVKVGDQVVSYSIARGHLHANGKPVARVASRPFHGDLITVKVGPSVSRYTPNHFCVVRIGKALDGTHLVYLQRRGHSFRVGRTCRGSTSIGPMLRAQAEKADAMWILSQHDSLEAATKAEALASYRFGVPMMLFEAPSRNKERARRVIDSFWDQIGDLTENARACLVAHGRLLEFPFWSEDNTDLPDAVAARTGGGILRRRPMVLRACNLMDGMQVLSTWETFIDQPRGQPTLRYRERWSRYPGAGHPRRRLCDLFDERYLVTKLRPGRATNPLWQVIDLGQKKTVGGHHPTMGAGRAWVEAHFGQSSAQAASDSPPLRAWISHQWEPITVSRETQYVGPVYSLEVAEDHTYVADGVITHNCATVEEVVLNLANPLEREALALLAAVDGIHSDLQTALKATLSEADANAAAMEIYNKVKAATRDHEKLDGEAGDSRRLSEILNRCRARLLDIGPSLVTGLFKMPLEATGQMMKKAGVDTKEGKK